MAAKGEHVDLNELAKNEQAEGGAKTSMETRDPLPVNGTSNAAVEQPQTISGASSTNESNITAPSVPAGQAPPAATPSAPTMGAAMPQALLNSGKYPSNPLLSRNEWLTMISVQDEGLKNLMMSWYYAGYYTGLLEGQQKAFASMQQGG